MEIPLKVDSDCIGRFQDIVDAVGSDFIKGFEWKIKAGDYWNCGDQTITSGEKFALEKFVPVSSGDLLNIAPHIQFCDTEFVAFQNGQKIFILKTIDTTQWYLDTEDKNIIDFFKSLGIYAA